MTVDFFDQYAMEVIGLTIAFLTLLATLRTNIKRLLIEILFWQKNFYYRFDQKNEIEVEISSIKECDLSPRNYTTINNLFEKRSNNSEEIPQSILTKDNKSRSNENRNSDLFHVALGALTVIFITNLIFASGDSFFRILKYCISAILVFVIIPLCLLKLFELLSRKSSAELSRKSPPI